MILVGWLTFGTVFFALSTSLLSPRVTLWVRWAQAAVSHHIAKAARRLLDHEGRPLRASALAFFIAGSMLDFLGTLK